MLTMKCSYYYLTYFQSSKKVFGLFVKALSEDDAVQCLKTNDIPYREDKDIQVRHIEDEVFKKCNFELNTPKMIFAFNFD